MKNRDELVYRQAMARIELMTYIFDYKFNDKAYDYAIRMLNKIKDYEKDKRATNEDLISYIFSGRIGTHKTDIIDEFLKLLLDHLNGNEENSDDVAIGIVDVLLRYGDKQYDSVKDELKDFLLMTLPDFSEEEASAFIRDDLLSERGLACKSAFWDSREQ